MSSDQFLGNADIQTIDALYQQYKQDPDSLDISWKRFFEGFEFQNESYPVLPDGSRMNAVTSKEFKVISLINAYRTRGHLFTKTNPVRERRKYSPTLAIENFGLTAADLEETFHAGTDIGIGDAKLKDIVSHLENSYCQSIGVEFMYIREPERVEWLRSKIEAVNKPKY